MKSIVFGILLAQFIQVLKNMHYEVNLKGTENVAKACIKKNVRRIIYMSTDSVFGYASKENKFFTLKQKQKPYKDYGYSKFLAENLLMRYSANDLLDVTIFRGFWFFGPNMLKRNKKFLKSFFWPRQIVFGNGLNYRSITHIDDIFNAFVKATKSSKSFGKSYWITTLTKTRNVNQIYQLISNSLNKKFKPVYIPNFVCEIILYFDSAYTFVTGRINSTTFSSRKIS